MWLLAVFGSNVFEVTTAVSVMVSFPGTVTLRTSVVVADALLGGVAGSVASVHFTVPVEPTPGALHDHAPGWMLPKTVPFGRTFVSANPRAS
jgi:hypothetical protein